MIKNIAQVTALMALALAMTSCIDKKSDAPVEFRFDPALANRDECNRVLASKNIDLDGEWYLTTVFYVSVDPSVDLEEYYFGVTDEEKVEGNAADLMPFLQSEGKLGDGFRLFISDEIKVFKSVTGPSWPETAISQACVLANNGIGLSLVRFSMHEM